ncbi:hypothetical protein ACFQDG_14890, partial [Natronoarchaeum mannanilyticum]|uniref:hypothetical protein n=1 Tax=Natronoarchaeum mannanilyticum TaxID=926360 RepID=UPI00361FDD48
PVERDAAERAQDGEFHDADSEASGGLVGGGPTTTVSQEGIDEVFEKLEAETPDRGDDADDVAGDAARADDETITGDDQTDAPPGSSSSDDGFGTLSGGGPATTVSDEGVDEIVSQVSDDLDYATFEGDDAPDVAAETEVDPDAVFPGDWETADADEEADAVPEPDEHSPDEDAEDLRPDDDAVLNLFADVADEVNEGSSTAETPDEAGEVTDESAVDLTESTDGLFEDESDDGLFDDDAPGADPDSIADDAQTDDEFEMDDDGFATDDGLAANEDAEPTEDGLDPGLAAEVDALLSAADEVDSGTGSGTTVDSLDDAETRDEPAAAPTSSHRDAEAQTESDEEPSSDSSPRLALNASDDAGVEWSEGGEDDEQAWVPLETSESGAATSNKDDDTTPEDGRADDDGHDERQDDDADLDERQDDERSFVGLRYARATAGWLRSLLARLA